MRKKIVAIMAAVLAVLIIVAVVVGMKGKSEKAPEIQAETGVTDSIFDDETVEDSDTSEVDDNSDEGDKTETVDTSKDGGAETPEEVIIGDEPAKNTGNHQNDKSDKTDKNDKSDKNDKPDKSEKPDKKPGKKPSVKEDGKMTYEEFHAMDPSDQQAYMESFDDIEDFFKWYNKAKEKYEKDNPSIEIDGDSIDLDKIANE